MGGHEGLSRWVAAPIILVLVATLLFFGTLNRHEMRLLVRPPLDWGQVFSGVPSSTFLRLAGDLLMVGGSLAGISSLCLLFLHSGRWRRAAAISLAAFSLGLATSAARLVGLVGSVVEWQREVGLGVEGGGVVVLLEVAAFAAWIALSVGLVYWRRERFRRATPVLLMMFGVLTACAIILGLLGLASRWSYYGNIEIQFVGGHPIIWASYWDSLLSRACWYYCLLFLIPFAVVGWRVMIEGSEINMRYWLTGLTLVAPSLVLVGLFSQFSAGAYWHSSNQRFWPIWIPAVACLDLILLRLGGRAEDSKCHGLALSVSAVSLSLVGVGVWFWVRGPSLHWLHGALPGLRTAWVPVIRLLVPSCLVGAGVAGVIAASRLRGFGVHEPYLSGWRVPWGFVGLSPIVFSGILLLVVVSEYLARIWMAYRVVLPPGTIFPQATLIACGIVLVGAFLASGRLALIVETASGMIL